MASAPPVLKGTVHGKIIQLEDEPGLPDGQSVTVTLMPASQKALSGETLLEAQKRAAGRGWQPVTTAGLNRHVCYRSRE